MPNGGRDAPAGPGRIADNIAGVRTDDEFEGFMAENKDGTVLVKWGSSWCTHCKQIFPSFLKLTKEFKSTKYVVGQVDYMQRNATDLKFTPTFSFYRKGKKVDEFWGIDAQKLRDHMWLQHD